MNDGDGSLMRRFKHRTEPERHNTGAAGGSCDPETGKFEWKWFVKLNERAIKCGIKDCIAEHEEVHVEVNSSCCSRYAKCMKNAKDRVDVDRCKKAWNSWSGDAGQKAWDEFLAYTAHAACLDKKIKGHEKDGDPDCCVLDLIESMANAEGKAKENVANAKPKDCTFNADGTINIEIPSGF